MHSEEGHVLVQRNRYKINIQNRESQCRVDCLQDFDSQEHLYIVLTVYPECQHSHEIP